jgi:hypothetical protein
MRVYCTLGAILLLSVPPSGHADVVFSDYGPGYSYNVDYGYTVGYERLDYVPAAAFTPASDYTLTQIDLSIGYVQGINSVKVDLLQDSNGVPGALIESWNLRNLDPFGSVGVVETVAPVSTVSLLGGTEYWVEVTPRVEDTPRNGGTWAGWNWNSQGVSGDFYQTSDGTVINSGPNTLPAFEVLGTVVTAVPEPGFVLPVASLLAALLVRRKRLASR